ncbi:hypothetical protein EB241_07000 [Erwinia psidii]|uniref:Uncharacterized protein n=3 Tax=Erwinia psidii TaxID=69224 RepID=A0A3N6SC44_9GAMM|nr:hypothetical protein EB241_07000 [Erwinia psidii]
MALRQKNFAVFYMFTGTKTIMDKYKISCNSSGSVREMQLNSAGMSLLPVAGISLFMVIYGYL